MKHVFPLDWPSDQPVTPSNYRIAVPSTCKDGNGSAAARIGSALDNLGITNVEVSANLGVGRKDGLFLSGGAMGNPGAVLRFTFKKRAYVGAHPGTSIPLGYPAGLKTRRMRAQAHEFFDPIWKAKKLLVEQKPRSEREPGYNARNAAYAWLAQQLGISPSEAHISMMDAATCQRVIDLCVPILKRINTR